MRLSVFRWQAISLSELLEDRAKRCIFFMWTCRLLLVSCSLNRTGDTAVFCFRGQHGQPSPRGRPDRAFKSQHWIVAAWRSCTQPSTDDICHWHLMMKHYWWHAFRLFTDPLSVSSILRLPTPLYTLLLWHFAISASYHVLNRTHLGFPEYRLNPESVRCVKCRPEYVLQHTVCSCCNYLKFCYITLLLILINK